MGVVGNIETTGRRQRDNSEMSERNLALPELSLKTLCELPENSLNMCHAGNARNHFKLKRSALARSYAPPSQVSSAYALSSGAPKKHGYTKVYP